MKGLTILAIALVVFLGILFESTWRAAWGQMPQAMGAAGPQYPDVNQLLPPNNPHTFSLPMDGPQLGHTFQDPNLGQMGYHYNSMTNHPMTAGQMDFPQRSDVWNLGPAGFNPQSMNSFMGATRGGAF